MKDELSGVPQRIITFPPPYSPREGLYDKEKWTESSPIKETRLLPRTTGGRRVPWRSGPEDGEVGDEGTGSGRNLGRWVGKSVDEVQFVTTVTSGTESEVYLERCKGLCKDSDGTETRLTKYGEISSVGKDLWTTKTTRTDPDVSGSLSLPGWCM